MNSKRIPINAGYKFNGFGFTSEKIVKTCNSALQEKLAREEQYKEEANKRFKELFKNKKWR